MSNVSLVLSPGTKRALCFCYLRINLLYLFLESPMFPNTGTREELFMFFMFVVGTRGLQLVTVCTIIVRYH